MFDGGRLVVSFLVKDDFAEVGAAEPYSEGIIDFLRAVEAQMAVLIREPPSRARSPQGQPAVELGGLDVSAIARKAGGGGHRQARGPRASSPSTR